MKWMRRVSSLEMIRSMDSLKKAIAMMGVSAQEAAESITAFGRLVAKDAEEGFVEGFSMRLDKLDKDTKFTVHKGETIQIKPREEA